MNPSCLQSNTKNILPYHISTLSSKIQYTTWYYNSQRQKISQNPFPTKHLLKQTTYLLLEAKTSSYFIACTQSCQVTMYATNKFQVQTLSWRTLSLNNDAQNSRQAFFQIILDCHISNYYFLLDFVEPISYQIIFHLVNTTLVIKYWKYSSLWFWLDGRKIVVEVHYS